MIKILSLNVLRSYIATCILTGLTGLVLISCGSGKQSSDQNKEAPQSQNTPTPTKPEAIDFKQIRSVGLYMVPTLEFRNALSQVHPNNQYFSLWGGPHATLAGFVSMNQKDLKKLVSKLATIDLKEHKPLSWNQTETSQLLLANFNSDKMDRAAQMLKTSHHPKIKSNWHLTMGYKTQLNAQMTQQMTTLLAQSQWEWIVALKKKDGSILWVSPEQV